MDSAYLLIPVLLISSFLYFFTFLLVKTGILAQSIHRKVWNLILLITFLVTAILGLLLIIQINYKLEWSLIKTILKWHVNFGIGLSFVAIVHLIRHFQYFLKLFKKEEIAKQYNRMANNAQHESIERLTLLILLSGFVSTVVQVLFLRELTTVFQGNELMMSWALGIWMLITGTGALIGSKSRLTLNRNLIVKLIIIVFAIVPLIYSITLVLLRNIIFPPGVLVHPGWFIVVVFILFTPLCLLTGWLFSIFVSVSQKKKNGFVKVYVLETIGSIAGGLVVSFLFIWYLNIFESLIITSAIIFISLYFTTKNKICLLGIAVFTMFFAVFQIFPINQSLFGFLFYHQQVKECRETWHGNVAVTENSGQYNIYENGNLLFTSDNKILNEEYVHYAMLQHTSPRKVLLISGGMAGMLNEILKYNSIEKVVYIEPNTQLERIVTPYLPLPIDKRISLVNGDPARYIRNTHEKYDAVIMAIPDPASLQINRFYTLEYIGHLKKSMTPGGIVLYGISPAGNYLTTEKTELEASMFNNMKAFFRYVEIIPGEKDYFIASDSAISIRIGDLSRGWENRNVYVNPYYMDDKLITARNQSILSVIANHRNINTEDKPHVVFSHSMQFISMFGNNNSVFVMISLFLLLLPLFFMKAPARGMFVAGVTASSIEITLIFIFQLVFGYVYSAIGLIIALFMAGLAIGSLAAGKIKDVVHIRPYACLLLAASMIIILFSYKLMEHADFFISNLILFIILLIPSSLVGFLYVVYSGSENRENISTPTVIYAADLLGSAFGIVAVTVYLLPVCGITATCYILGGINVLPVLFGFKKLSPV
jgi:spermidine synthase